MQYIIAISGRKNAGKNTVANAIKSAEYHQYDSAEFSFADDLKEFCINVLGLEPYMCYGSDDEKNLPTQYIWDTVPGFLRWKFSSDTLAKFMIENGFSIEEMREYYYNNKPAATKCGNMSGREIMQLFGTELIREVFGNIWAQSTIRRIKRTRRTLNIITDCRFPNEIHTVLSEPFGFVIRLTRSPFGFNDMHPSESSLDTYDWNKDKCFVLDNANLSITEQEEAIKPIVNEIFGSAQ